MTEKELALFKQMTAEMKKQVRFQEEIAKATDRVNAAIEKAKTGDIRDIRRLARQTEQFDPNKGFIFINPDTNKPEFITEKEFTNSVNRGEKAVDQIRRNIQSELVGSPEAPSKGFRINELLGALATGNIGAAMGELLQPFGGDDSVGERMIERGNARRAASETIRGRA